MGVGKVSSRTSVISSYLKQRKLFSSDILLALNIIELIQVNMIFKKIIKVSILVSLVGVVK